MKRFKNNYLTALAVFLSRFSGLPANVSPMGSFGFFGGNFWLYTALMVGNDLLKGGMYRGFYITYIGFISYYVFGKIARTTKQKILLLPVASLLFFLISNFGVWLYWYPRTFEALLRCYTVAVPFYRNTLLGDMAFGYGYLLIKTGCLTQMKRVFTKMFLNDALYDRS